MEDKIKNSKINEFFQRNMNRALLCTSLVLSISLFLSCEQLEDDEDIVVQHIKAGVYDSTFNYYPLNDQVDITLSPDSTGWYLMGNDTLILFISGDTLEMNISLKLVNPDSTASDIYDSGTFLQEYLDIEHPQDFKIADTVCLYGIGLGQYAMFIYHKSYSLDENIYANNEGILDTGYHATLPNYIWEFAYNYSGGIHGFDGGLWRTSSNIRYLGFSYKGKLGWIKLDNTDIFAPKFLSVAVQK